MAAQAQEEDTALARRIKAQEAEDAALARRLETENNFSGRHNKNRRRRKNAAIRSDEEHARKLQAEEDTEEFMDRLF